MPEPVTAPVAVPLPVVTPFYLDKAVWMAVLAPLLALANQKWGLALDATSLIALVLPVVAYIIMHKWKTATLQVAQAAGAAAAADPKSVLGA